MSREIMQQALDALSWIANVNAMDYEYQRKAREPIESLRQALTQPEQEPVAWRNAAIRLGEDLYSVGPDGYYDMTAKQWLDWALSVVNTAQPEQEQEPEIVRRVRRYAGKRRESVSSPHINAKECILLANWIDSMLAQPEQEPKLSDAGADTNIPLWGLEPKGSGMVALHQREWVCKNCGEQNVD